MATPRITSLYSGAGGLDLGFALAGFGSRFANDLDTHAPKTFSAFREAAMPGVREHLTYVTGDLSKGKYESLDEDRDGLLIGGPPCQGFSRAGRMDPNDPRSKHVGLFIDALAIVKPAGFVLENVSALATNPRWSQVLDSAMKRAERLGYSLALRVLDSSDYGVPQFRNRMFLLGIRDRAQVHHLHADMPNEPHVSVRQALSGIEPFRNHPESLRSNAIITPAKRPVIRVSPFAGMLFNGQGRPLDLEKPAPTISASLGGNHTPIIDQLWLENEEQSGATESYHAAITKGLKTRVPSEWRRLSVQEAAHLQSFPQLATWPVPKSVAYRQIGNAVPPMLSFVVASLMGRAMGLPEA